MNNALFQISAPANLLLFGEYAVTEEGGLGIAAAVQSRLIVTVYPSSDLRFFSHWEEPQKIGKGIIYSSLDPFSNRLIEAILESTKTFLKTNGLSTRLSGSYYLDSTQFQTAAGQKSGLGSSAALSAALTGALLYYHEPNLFIHNGLSNQLFLTALEAHRSFQNRQGSGYDVAVSVFGSTGLFTGGIIPRWTPLPLPWLKKISLVNGFKPTATSKALELYLQWKTGNPDNARKMLNKNNQLIHSLLETGNYAEIQDTMIRLKNQGLYLGECINVNASIPDEMMEWIDILKKMEQVHDPQSDFPFLFKALGAGNELFALINPPAVDFPSSRTCAIDREGLKIEFHR